MGAQGMIDGLSLVLGSALVASVVAGAASLATTYFLIKDQRRARTEQDRLTKERQSREVILSESARFLDHFVGSGLEQLAADLDIAAHIVDGGLRDARRNRSLVGGMKSAQATIGPISGQTWQEILEIQRALPVRYPVHGGFKQACLLPFPGDFMQSMLAFNRCVALADDWLQRYPWTTSEKLPALDRFLENLHTTLAAAARSMQAAAAVSRQIEPRRYLDWFPTVLADARLVGIAADLKALVDRQLGQAPQGADHFD